MQMLVDIAIPVVVIMMMFVVGLELALEDFRRIHRYPKPVLIGTAGQLIILPVMAAALAFALDPPRHIVAGMVLVAACPGGAISNYYVYLARANVALSVTLTAVTTVLAFVALPVLTALGFKLLLDQQEAVPIPISDMMRQLFVVLLLPIAAGMWTRHRWTAWVRRHGNLLRQISMAALVLLIAFIIQDQAKNLAVQIGELLLTAALFTLFAMMAGIVVGRGLGLPPPPGPVLLHGRICCKKSGYCHSCWRKPVGTDGVCTVRSGFFPDPGAVDEGTSCLDKSSPLPYGMCFIKQKFGIGTQVSEA